MSNRFGVEWHDSLPSTNDRAMELARAGANRVAVVSRTQTAGRGRRGNAWSSPPGGGLYVSFVARPQVAAARSPLLTLMCGVAVLDAFSPHARERLGLKWPNDVLAAGPGPHATKKLAGILVESALAGEALAYAVFGIGVNLTRAAHVDEEAARRAVSLTELGGPAMDAETAYDAVEHQLAALLDRAEAGDVDFVPEAWEERALGSGATISVRMGDEAVIGRLLGLASDGGLRLETAAGPRVLHTGEVDPASLIPQA